MRARAHTHSRSVCLASIAVEGCYFKSRLNFSLWSDSGRKRLLWVGHPKLLFAQASDTLHLRNPLARSPPGRHFPAFDGEESECRAREDTTLRTVRVAQNEL